MEIERRQLSLLFADLVGYSSLMEKNESIAIELLETYRRIFVSLIEENEGVVVEFIGDAIFARFDQPEHAINASISIQKALLEFNQTSSSTPVLRARIGIHMGRVNIKEGALYGDDVNIAARLESISVAEGICISEQVYKAVKPIDVHIKSLGRIKLKNIDQKVKAYLLTPNKVNMDVHAHYFFSYLGQVFSAYKYLIICGLFLVSFAAAYYVPRWLIPGYAANYVEISDFKNLMSEQGDADYLSAGITDAVRSQLADISDLYLLDADKGIRGAVHLEGSVQKNGENLRIAYKLIRRKDAVQIAGGKLDGRYNDIFILQDRLVAEIAGVLANEFDLSDYRPATLKLTSDIAAYEYYLRGIEFLKKPDSHDNYDSALKSFSTALVHDAEFALAYAGMCRVYVSKYAYTRDLQWATKAEEYCLSAMQKDDGASEIYDSLAQLYRKTGRTDEAILIVQKAIDLDPNNVRAHLSLAKLYRAKNELERAEALHKKIRDEHPNFWLAHQELAFFYINTSRFEEAIAAYQTLLDITPENSRAFSNLGVAYMYLNNFKQAATAFKRSVEITPSSWGYSNSGVMYYFSGDFEEAAEHFTQAIRLAPKDFRWYLNLADALRQLPGQHEKAKENYVKSLNLARPALSVNADDVRVHQYMSLSLLYIGDIEKAEQHLKRAQALAPQDIDVLYTSLKFLTKLKRYDEALETMTALLDQGYSMALIKADPDLHSLMSHTQFKDVLSAALN